MGKGMAFLSLKFFHPANKENQRRKWEAIQRDNANRKKIQEREQTLRSEEERQQIRLLLANSAPDYESYKEELQKAPVAWMYDEPPGLKKTMEQEKKKIEEDNRKKEWQEAMQKMSKNERRLAEKQIEQGLSIHERNVHRFEFLKNAPVEAEYVKDMEVQHKPFGKVLRHVKCFKCGKWGHSVNDRECEVNNHPLHYNEPKPKLYHEELMKITLEELNGQTKPQSIIRYDGNVDYSKLDLPHQNNDNDNDNGNDNDNDNDNDNNNDNDKDNDSNNNNDNDNDNNNDNNNNKSISTSLSQLKTPSILSSSLMSEKIVFGNREDPLYLMKKNAK